MIREHRYLVVKWEDINTFLSPKEQLNLDDLLYKIECGREKAGKEPAPDFVCVKSDWPEYEKVWKMIEDRVDSTETL